MPLARLSMNSFTKSYRIPPYVGDGGMLGRIVSHYKVESTLGEGGMGVVYRALDLQLNRPVALKFLHPTLTGSTQQVASLEKEALAISALNHPNIATIYGIEETDGGRFIVLEYLPGGTLKSRIEKSRLPGKWIPLDEALEYGIQIAEGLAHAHAHGIIHRDVKSSNILFTAQGTLKLVDFSLARSDQDPTRTVSSFIVGTPSSMSPEQALGNELDHRSDIFSVGIVLFELLTGIMPFRATQHTVVLQQIISSPAPPLGRFRPGVPATLEAIVATALQKDRVLRYQHISELAVDLKSVRKQLALPTGNIAALETITIPVPPRKSRVTRRVGLVVLLVSASVATYELPWIRRSAMSLLHWTPLPAEKRLVVLNFANAGNSLEFCEGLMDVISSKLTEMEQFHGSLLVISPSEVRKAEVHTPSEAREAFGATLAITGSVRRLGARMEILMNLVDTETLAQLRSFTIETEFPDPATLQEGLVSKASEMLDIALAPGAFLFLQDSNTQISSAYRYYIEGRGYLQRFDKLEYLDQAMSLFRKATQLDPRYALAYSGLADACLERYNATKDPQSLDEALNSASRAVGIKGGLPEVRVTMGRVLAARGQYEEAEREFQQALKSDPVNAEAYRRLARTYERMNRQKDAEQTFRRSIELRPNDWRGYQSLATFYFNHGKQAEAVQYYQRVLRLTPGNYNAYNDLGAAYLQLGNYPEAAVQLRKSVELKPLAMNYSNIGSMYYYQGKYQDAAGWYEKAVAAANTNSSFWGNLADAYRWSPELSSKAPDAYGKALFFGRRELSGNGRNHKLRSRLAYYYAAIGDHESASREIAEALRLANNDGYVLFQSAVVFEQLHNRNAALEAVKAALRAGYPAEAVRKAPLLADLRKDSRFSSRVISK